MANLKVPNLCGASLEFNAIQDKFETLINNSLSALESDASTLASTMNTDTTSLLAEVRAIVATVPGLPDVNLQSQLTSLSKLTPGSFEHIALLAAIALKFGTELKTKGYTLNDLVKVALAAIVSGEDLCSKIPNFEVPADGASAAVEKAVESKQATVDSEEEKLSTIVKNVNITRAKTLLLDGIKLIQSGVPFPVEQEDAYEEDVAGNPNLVSGTTPPTKDIGDFVVAIKTTAITTSSGFKVTSTTAKDATVETIETRETEEETSTITTTTTEASKEQSKPATAQTSVGGSVPTETKTPTSPTPQKPRRRKSMRRRKRSKKNVSKKGFTGRRTLAIETFSKLDGNSVTLKHEPHSISGPSAMKDAARVNRARSQAYKFTNTADLAILAYYSDASKEGSITKAKQVTGYYKAATGQDFIWQNVGGDPDTSKELLADFASTFGDTFTIKGKVLTITQSKNGPYGGTTIEPGGKGEPDKYIQVPKGTILEVAYWYYDTYDPRFVKKG